MKLGPSAERSFNVRASNQPRFAQQFHPAVAQMPCSGCPQVTKMRNAPGAEATGALHERETSPREGSKAIRVSIDFCQRNFCATRLGKLMRRLACEDFFTAKSAKGRQDRQGDFWFRNFLNPKTLAHLAALAAQ
ncbi:MAG TPA: hypothetical protein VGK73_31005 [Polyangiaceae bacterium]